MKRALTIVIAGAVAAMLSLSASATAVEIAEEPTPTPTASVSPSPSPSPTMADPVRAQEYWLDQYGITEAWKTTKGAGVTIAVIDTGVAHNAALDGAVIGGADFSGAGSEDGRTPVGVKDANHGTYVASLLAARESQPDVGMIGVAPEADILAISVGFGSSATVPFVDQLADAIVWAVDEGADIINLSLTTNQLSWHEKWDEAFQYAFDNDVVVIVAAGNRGSGTSVVGAPATIPGVLTIAGVDPTGKASIGASTQGITIGVAAPSEKLLGIAPDGSIVQWDGTSGAAPIVAGVAALVRSAHPDLDAANVIQRLIETATPVPGAASPSPLYGFGLINANAAVTATNVTHVDENPMGSLAEWVRIYRRADAPQAPQQQGEVPQVQIPELPPVEAQAQKPNPLMPSLESIRNGSIPLIAVTLPGILLALGVTAAARSIRSARESRTSSNDHSKEISSRA